MVKKILLALSLSFLSFDHANAGGSELDAWWLRVQFPVSDKKHFGLSAEQIDPKWAQYSLISYEALPAEAKPDISWMKRENLAFSSEGDFNKNGLADHAVVGDFKTKDGQAGRFFLVVEKQNTDIWKVIFLHKEIGEAGFSVIAEKDKAIYWAPCMQCGEFRRLVDQNSNLVLE